VGSVALFAQGHSLPVLPTSLVRRGADRNPVSGPPARPSIAAEEVALENVDAVKTAIKLAFVDTFRW